jgi:hypothetical protein
MGEPATASINGGPFMAAEFEMNQSWVDVSTLAARRFDPCWEFVDAVGHFHAFDHDGKLPTLTRVEEFVAYQEPDEDGEEGYTITRLDCSLCGETVKPDYVPDDPRKVIPGRVDFRLTVQAVVPRDRFSVVVRTSDRVWFGYGAGAYAAADDYGVMVTTVPLGPMWRRPTVGAPVA